MCLQRTGFETWNVFYISSCVIHILPQLEADAGVCLANSVIDQME